MPSTLSFPVSLPAAPVLTPTAFATTPEAAPEAGLSFESLLNAGPTPSTPTAADVSEFSIPTPPSPAATDPATPVLTPAQLAELLSLMQAPAAQPQPVAVTPEMGESFGVAMDAPAEGDTAVAPVEGAARVTTAANEGDARAAFEPVQNFPTTRTATSEFSAAAAAQPAQKTADHPPSVRELLAEGAETLELELTSTNEGGAETPAFRPVVASTTTPSVQAIPAVKTSDVIATAPEVSAKIATPTPEKIAAPANELPSDARPVATESTPSAVTRAQTPLVAERAFDSAPAISTPTRQEPVVGHRPIRHEEKTAASPIQTSGSTVSGVVSSSGVSKNKFLNVDNKELKLDDEKVGTHVANWGDPMKSTVVKTPSADAPIAGPAASVAPQAHTGTSTTLSAKPEAATPAAAVQMVREIRDIADGLWAVERNSVEVRFRMGDGEPLSVRVEYKDGVVQTTFRTESPELRDTLAREWQAQISASADTRPYRVADPVFNTPSQDERGSFADSDASGRQPQARQDDEASRSGAHASSFGSRFTRSGSVDTTAPASRTYVRPDTALHLHALA